jgi:hypothetical protein
MAARQLPWDWQAVYGYTPVLLETFFEKDLRLNKLWPI